MMLVRMMAGHACPGDGRTRSTPGCMVLHCPHQPDVTLIPVFLDAFVDEPGGDLLRFDGRRWTVTNERIRGLAFTRSR